MFPSLLPSRRRQPHRSTVQENRAAAAEPTGRGPTGWGGTRFAPWQRSNAAAWRFLLRGLSEICYPPTCVLCHGPWLGHGPWEAGGAPGGARPAGSAPAAAASLCRDCRATLAATAVEFACDRCSRPQPPVTPAPVTPAPVTPAPVTPALDAAIPEAAEIAQLCAACRKRPGEIRRSVAVGMYRDVMREAVVAAKRLSFQPLTLALGELLGQRVREAWGAVPIGAVTFIPSHWIRRWGRGGCPAQLLAQQVGRQIGAPVVPLLRSCRRTAKQGTLGDAERRTNVCGAFKAKKGYALLAPRVLVVDDVWTTGATLEEAARVIRQGYDVEVFAAVLARAIGTHDG